MAFPVFSLVMAKEKKTRSDLTLTKKPMTFRFTPETIRKLGAAAVQEGMSMTVYVELALKAQFRKDGILAPKKEDASREPPPSR
jgi:hypothetical protein